MADAIPMTLAEQTHRRLILASLATDPALATIRAWNTRATERGRQLETDQIRRAITHWASHG
jgi:hypothetical protein